MKQYIKQVIAGALCIALAFVITGCRESNKPISPKSVTSSKEDAVKDISDPQNYDDNTPSGDIVDSQTLKVQQGKANGIDVSKWQGKIDWAKVKDSSIDFAIIRIGYRGENGIIYKDSNADYNIQQAQKSGVLVGVYFFSTATSIREAIQEAQWTVEAIKGYCISYPVVYDCEGFLRSESRMYHLTAKQRTDNAIAFLDEIKKNGYEGMFYSATSQLEDENCWETKRISDAYMVWIARYTTPAYPQTVSPDYEGRYDMWQYTNRGEVRGIPGNVDMIVSYFTRPLSVPKDSSEKPADANVPTDFNDVYANVNEIVTAKEFVNLREGAGMNYDIVGTLKNGANALRTGIGTNGWSRLIVNGKSVYAITSYLTTDLSYKVEIPDIVAGNTFVAVNDRVTAKEVVNLRNLPSIESEIVGVLNNGEYLNRTATSNRGWSRLDYNGQIVYAVTSYLKN